MIRASDITELKLHVKNQKREQWNFHWNGRYHYYVSCSDYCEIYEKVDAGWTPIPIFAATKPIPIPKTNREQHIANLLKLAILQ